MQQTNAIIKRVWLTMALLPLTFTSAAAQFFSHLSLSSVPHTVEYYNCHLSSNGKSCTAVVIEQNDSTFEVRLVFERSEDGGVTWMRQESGLGALTPIPGVYRMITGILQIDSLNVVAMGDSGFVIRTFDAGNTWRVQESGTHASLVDAHFSDPMNGIIVGVGPSVALTTSNGGESWQQTMLKCYTWPGQCHTTGFGKYQVFGYGYGPIYTTNDNWSHLDSTALIIDSAGRSYKALGYCRFAGDTLIAYGNSFYGSQNFVLIERSTDGGQNWMATADSMSYLGSARCLSPIDRDTIVAATVGINQVLTSFDNGVHWHSDTLIFDTARFQMPVTDVALLAGDKIAVVLGPMPNWLAFGKRQNSSVRSQVTVNLLSVYPNPATSLLYWDCAIPARICDALGRPYSVTYHDGTLDISTLPPGVYYVSDGKQRAKFVKE